MKVLEMEMAFRYSDVAVLEDEHTPSDRLLGTGQPRQVRTGRVAEASRDTRV